MSTLLDRIWSRHTVATLGEESLLYVDRNFVHEESTQAFEALADEGRPLSRPGQNVAFCDHYAPTRGRERGVGAIADAEVREMIVQLEANAVRHRLRHFGMAHDQQGIMHVVGPELGLVLPGFVITGSDSHACTNGAFGALAFGVGQSELRQVFFTQTVWKRKPKAMRIAIEGSLGAGVSAKDAVLHVIAAIGANGGSGYALEFAGSCVRSMSMEARMTLCNMSIEAGSQAGMVAPDATTVMFLEERSALRDTRLWNSAVEAWLALHPRPDAHYDRDVHIDAAAVQPTVTWGTSLDDSVAVDGCVPDPATVEDGERRARMQRALDYMGLAAGTAVSDIAIDLVFIGSCSNSRLDDLRSAARVVEGRRARVPAVVSPGSRSVKRAAEAEGLDAVFTAAGFEWRDSGCSMCVGSNGDVVQRGKRCASTSPRNFEGRQGPGARTHVMSPAMAAAAAVTGRITDVRKLLGEA
ncbi:MAG TPA: 3-isopropylmalate dehydratase large subunit [Burkholderiales bacterium]|nr:3-isopropylmalate dehydratase large subunit [Burkholderiales bacterium]